MPFNVDPSLGLGMRGAEIRSLQDVLVVAGLQEDPGGQLFGDLWGALDAERSEGVFGAATKEAVKRVRMAAGLDWADDGVIGEETAIRLREVGNGLDPSDPRLSYGTPSRAAAFASLVQPLGEARVAMDRFVGLMTKTEKSDFSSLADAAADARAARGAGVLVSLIAGAGVAEEKREVVDKAWFKHGGPPSEGMRRDAVSVLTAAISAAAVGRNAPEGYGSAIVKLMFVQSPTLQLVRDVVLGRDLLGDRPFGEPGRPVPEPPIGPLGGGVDPRIPDWIDFEDVRNIACVMDLQSGLGAIAGALNGVARPGPKQGASISDLRPRNVCGQAIPPQQITLVGTGFGTERQGDAVYIDDKKANVVTGRWTDTEIVVEVPAGLTGEVCVSVLENTASDLTGLGDAIGAATMTEGVLADCFRIEMNLAGGLIGIHTPRAQCAPFNRFWVGPPAIDSFLANDSNQLARVRNGESFNLSWSTRFADSVSISAAAITGQLHQELRLPQGPGSVGGSGRKVLGPVPRRDKWEVEYTLSATNACGTSTRSVRVAFELQVGVAFLGSGVRTVFHVGAMEALADQLETAPRGVASGGMGALAALTMAQNFRDPTPLALAWDGMSVPTFSPNAPFDGMQAVSFLIDEDPAIRQIFEDFEKGMYADLLEGVYAVINEALLSYADAGALEVPPITVADNDAIVRAKLEKAMIDAGMTVAKTIGGALDSGGESSSPLGTAGKVTGESVGAVLSDSVASGAKVAIAGAGKALFKVNPAIGIVFIVVAYLVQAGIEAGMAIDKANKMRAALAARGLFRTTMLDSLFDDLVQRLGLVGRTIGTPVSMALGAAHLEEGRPVYFGNFGNLNDARGRTIQSSSAGFENVLKAVSAIPGAMAPQVVGGATVADTTSVDYAPLEPLHRMGVDEIYAVHATLNVLTTPPAGASFNSAGFLTVMRRAERIRDASAVLTAGDPFVYWRDDDAPATTVGSLRARVRHIVPTLSLPLLNAFDFEPGLRAIWQDYGYMRAFDVLAPLKLHPVESADVGTKRTEIRNLLAASSDLITGLRAACWRLEHRLNKARDVALGFSNRREGERLSPVLDVADLERLRVLKRAIATAVTERLALVRRTHQFEPAAVFPGAAVPTSRFASWHAGYERHPWTFSFLAHVDPTGGGAVTPWQAIVGFSIGSSVAAATAPTVDPVLLTPAR